MIISHGSGSGFALDVIKAGNGEAIRVQKTSGSGNAMTISGGNFEAGTIVKTGGTSSQFLKADGSVDSNTYLTTGTAASTYITIATPTTITGVKTFDTGTLILAAAGTANSTHLRNSSGDGTSVSGSNVFGFNSSNNIYVRTESKGGFIFNFNNGAANRTYTLQDASGTLALTSDLGSYVPYTGATGGVDLGTHSLSSNNLIANGGLNAGALLLKNANAASTINTGYLTLSPSSTTTRVTFGFSTGASTWKSLSFSSHLLTDNTPTIFSFPNGGGTLAVTTDLGAYLPLAGGTLTGALNGTSASFTGNVNLATSTGQVGIGVTPSAWNTAYKAIQFGSTGALFGEVGDSANYLTSNAFIDSVGFKYITSDFATGYFQENGVHSFKTAVSGTAGNAITWTTPLSIASTGAATFSSSVTATSPGNSANSIVGNYSGGSQMMQFFQKPDGSNMEFNLRNSSGTAIARIDTNGNSFFNGGNVGIGTDSPTYKFVVSNGGAEGIEFDTGNLIAGRNYVINYNRSTSSYISCQIDASTIIFGPSGAERVRVTSDGLTFNGDTAAANALDDYEEGTWTPTFINANFSGTLTATYTKIGRVVTIQLSFVNATISSVTGNAQIGGLPFTSTNAYQAGSITYADSLSATSSFYVQNSNTNLYFIQGTGTTPSGWNAGVNNRSIMLTATYFTA
jgi:hypothetical protein